MTALKRFWPRKRKGVRIRMGREDAGEETSGQNAAPMKRFEPLLVYFEP